MTIYNFKLKVLIVATLVAFGFSRIGDGTDQPLDQANGIVTFVAAIVRLTTDLEKKNK